MKRTLITLSLLAAFSSILFAQNPLRDPVIPDGEIIRYRVTQDDETVRTEQGIVRLSENGRDYYLVSSSSPEQDTELRLLADGLVPVRTESVHRAGGAEYRTLTEIVRVPRAVDGAVFVIDTGDLIHVLRGYPFDDPQDLALRFVGSEGESEQFALKIRYVKEERVRINGGSRDAHKLELAAEMSGALALFSRMFPKTYLWYTVEEPHYLLRFEGSAGPGGGEVVTELESYRIGRP